jgi:hypothetical protein
LIDNFARDFRSRNDKYTAELKKEAEKYARDLEETASNYDASRVKISFEDFIRSKEEKLQTTIPPMFYEKYKKEFQDVIKARSAESKAGVPLDYLTTSVEEEVDEDEAVASELEYISGQIDEDTSEERIQELRQSFLEDFPTKNSLFDDYFNL